MIKIKTEAEIALIRHSGQINANTHKLISKLIKPGITTEELDKAAMNYILSQSAVPSFKDYQGFPKNICTSINDQVVHGIPSHYQLKNGDLIKIDIGVEYQGYHSDSARTYIVGETTPRIQQLVDQTKQALYEGISQVKSGNYVGDIAHAIEKHAKKYNLGVIRELVGHGVGENLHEEPNIPNYGRAKSGAKLEAGMIIAIEPMLNLGSRHITIKNDGWTIITRDGQPSAHFEHTVLVTADGYEILTGE